MRTMWDYEELKLIVPVNRSDDDESGKVREKLFMTDS